MGRTQRKRAKKKTHNRPQPLDHESNIINLKKFMTRNGFSDEINLKLRNFPETGRGIATSITLHENDVLITIPYNLMITYTTLHTSNFLHLFLPTSKLTIHDLLTTFLVVERHKKDSFWSDYVNSLPSEPPWLPALLSEEHVELLPVDVRLAVKKSRRVMEESWSRVRKSIKNDWVCCCCAKKASCVIDLHSFAWGYVLVNTRAVYVKPRVVRELSFCSGILSDQPCMALCPFLDMFNHSYSARTRAELVESQGNPVYRLTTLTKYKRHEQVFISYGDHDNLKLFTEYGFFIPGNPYDSVTFQREDVFKILALSLNDFHYKFIRTHDLDKSLSISEAGPSFNLKALLFVASYGGVANCASVIYSDNYPEDFLDKCQLMCRTLLHFACQVCDNVLQNLKSCEVNSLIVDFIRYRRDFIKKLCDNKQ